MSEVSIEIKFNDEALARAVAKVAYSRNGMHPRDYAVSVENKLWPVEGVPRPYRGSSPFPPFNKVEFGVKRPADGVSVWQLACHIAAEMLASGRGGAVLHWNKEE